MGGQADQGLSAILRCGTWSGDQLNRVLKLARTSKRPKRNRPNKMRALEIYVPIPSIDSNSPMNMSVAHNARPTCVSLWARGQKRRLLSSGQLLPLRARLKAPKLVTPGSGYIPMSATSSDDRGPRGLRQGPPFHATGRDQGSEALLFIAPGSGRLRKFMPVATTCCDR